MAQDFEVSVLPFSPAGADNSVGVVGVGAAAVKIAGNVVRVFLTPVEDYTVKGGLRMKARVLF